MDVKTLNCDHNSLERIGCFTKARMERKLLRQVVVWCSINAPTKCDELEIQLKQNHVAIINYSLITHEVDEILTVSPGTMLSSKRALKQVMNYNSKNHCGDETSSRFRVGQP